MTKQMMSDFMLMHDVEAISRGVIDVILAAKEKYPTLEIQDLKNVNLNFSQDKNNFHMDIEFRTLGGVVQKPKN